MAHGQLEFGWEPLVDVLEELLPLAKRHAQELGEGDLDPNWPWFFAQARAGVLRIFTARRDKTLVGYISFLVSANPWRQTMLMAVAEGFWLSPVERFGWNGVALFKNCEQGLKKAGVSRVSFSPIVDFCNDKGHTADLIFERLGYVKTEHRWSKWL